MPRRLRSDKLGTGWLFRYTDPVTKERKKNSVWIDDVKKATKSHWQFLDNLRQVAKGLPDESGWDASYTDLITRFIKEAQISTVDQRERLEKYLTENPLGLKQVAELTNIGKLNALCAAYIAKEERAVDGRGAHFVSKYVQSYLRQLTRWAASIQAIPYDPLQAWRKIAFGQHARRRAFEPHELRGILAAAQDLDTLWGHRNKSAIVFTTLLLAGNRPSAILAADVRQFNGLRIELPEGTGNKRNGRAQLPEPFAVMLASYCHGQDKNSPLLRSHHGERCDRHNIGKWFRRCCILAFVRQLWPALFGRPEGVEGSDSALQYAVAFRLYAGKPRGFDGPAPSTPRKLALREEKERLRKQVEDLALAMQPEIDQLLDRRDMYSLRSTFVSWARRRGFVDACKWQTGHAAEDTQERYYLDLVDASPAVDAVWEILTGRRDLAGKLTEPADLLPFEQTLAKAAGDELRGVVPFQVPPPKNPESCTRSGKSSSVEVKASRGVYNGAGEGVRTLDFDLGKTGEELCVSQRLAVEPFKRATSGQVHKRALILHPPGTFSGTSTKPAAAGFTEQSKDALLQDLIDGDEAGEGAAQ